MRKNEEKLNAADEALIKLLRELPEVDPPKDLAKNAAQMARMRMAAEQRQTLKRSEAHAKKKGNWINKVAAIAAALTITVGSVMYISAMSTKGSLPEEPEMSVAENRGNAEYAAGDNSVGHNVQTDSTQYENATHSRAEKTAEPMKSELASEIAAEFSLENMQAIEEDILAIEGIQKQKTEDGYILYIDNMSTIEKLIEDNLGELKLPDGVEKENIGEKIIVHIKFK